MSSSFNDESFDQPGGDDPFSYPPLSSQRFDSFSGKYPAADEDSPFFAPQPPSPPLIYSSPSDPAEFSPFKDENPFEDAFAASNGPILPPPTEMHDEGFALREWRRLNALRLEEKEKREKELLEEIINEAAGYKVEFYQKRQITMEAKKATCREKEKIFLASHDKFHAEADKHYWKAIAELIPNEVPTIEKKGKKDQDKKPSVAVIKGPKPGKPTELSRMRQIVLKLKHNTPTHLMYSPSPPPTTTTTNDANTGTASPITTKPVSVA